jgi:hypothetical protein
LATFDIILHVIPDPETGALFILPSESELTEGRNKLQASLQDAKQRAKSRTKSDRSVGEAQVRMVEDAIANLERLAAKRPQLLAKSEERVYTFTRPTYAEYLEFESAAKQMDEDGEVRVDNAILMQSLLPHCLKKIRVNKQEIEGGAETLEPNIGLHLWSKLQAACFPDNSRLPFIFSL